MSASDPLSKLVSENYRRVLRDTHAREPRWGSAGAGHRDEIAAFAEHLGASTILDYGCGQGSLKPSMPTFDVREFDPGVAGKDALPLPADLLVATDVLEHVEPKMLKETLRFMRSLALRGAFMVISLGLSKAVLADGRNAHLIVQPEEWWLSRLLAAGFEVPRWEVRKGLFVWART